ncbi:GH25 family lysozyme M1 (1,4-beta-N-acetylmuramidase), partial [Arthrobacter sp. CAN_A214]|uniref:GH25 family lysozyme n=1 Tax=Arthrobacter sp. CAN_A214 TaxID=2787720 RepID=UPI001A24A86D
MKSSNTLRLACRFALLASLLVGLMAPVAAVADIVDPSPSSESIPTGTPEPLTTVAPAPSTTVVPVVETPVPLTTMEPEVSSSATPEAPSAASVTPGTAPPTLSAEDELEQKLYGASLGQGLARIAEHGDPQVPTSAEQGLGAAAKAGVETDAETTTPDLFAAATNYWTPDGVLGVDVSSHQGTVNWAGAWNSGSRFAYVKATEYTSYINPFFSQQYTGAESVGMLRGAYHFALPSLSDGRTQADYFVANGGGWSADGKTLPPLLDVEYNPYTSLGNSCYNMTASQMVTWIGDFSDRMVQLTGRVPMIYTTADWWNTCTGSSQAFSDHPLHLARYSNSTAGTIPAGWSNYSLWQYTDSGPVVGDWNQWTGDLASLRDFARNGPSAPAPAPLPPVPLSQAAEAEPFIDAAAKLVPAVGAPVSEVVCGLKDNGCYRNYASGAVLWSTDTGAVASVNGAIRTGWLNSGAQDGPMGYPLRAEVCGIKDNGCYQSFQKGEIFWSATTGAHLSRSGGIRQAYRAAGAENGVLGYPTSAEICGLRDNGCSQSFQRGEILWSATTGAHVSRQGGIRQAYRAAGAENGVLGYPTSAEICGLRDNG